MIIESLDVVVFIELLSSYLNVVLPLSRDYVNHVCTLDKLAYSMLFHPIFLTSFKWREAILIVLVEQQRLGALYPFAEGTSQIRPSIIKKCFRRLPLYLA